MPVATQAGSAGGGEPDLVAGLNRKAWCFWSGIRSVILNDELERLERAEGDAVGALAVCDDIAPKMAFEAPTSERLAELLAALPPERPGSQAVREVKGVGGTSLGGERPKLTVLHRGQLWIAKLQDRGDPPHAPLREYVCMRLAASCGIQAADVDLLRVGEREVVLVRRFDRAVDAHGRTTRRLYASAHTVLRLDAAIRGDRSRSYVALAQALRRWCGKADVDVTAVQRELWRRMVFNAVCGNGDDHPRNHGVLFEDGRWRLADAFDIAPYPTFSGTLAMAVTREGDMTASRANLLKDCELFGYAREEARHHIAQCEAVLTVDWSTVIQDSGYPAGTLAAPDLRWLEEGRPSSHANPL